MERFPDFADDLAQQVKFYKCVHIYDRCNEKDNFSFYCDATFNSMNYAQEDYSDDAPRFSCLQYTEEDEVYYGQVMAIIRYDKRVRGEPNLSCRLVLMMARLEMAQDRVFENRKLPYNFMKYSRLGHRVIIDCISCDQIQGPLFYVPCLSEDMNIDSVGTVPTAANVSYFYVLSKETTHCALITSYEDYLNRNNTKYSFAYQAGSGNYVNMNPFLTTEEMIAFKESVNIESGKKIFDESIVEAYDFNFMDDYNED